MASIDATNRFLNQDKRYAEAVVMTVPAILSEGGGRGNTAPVYLQGGDSVKASVVEADTLVKRAYLDIVEAFPAGTLIAVDIAGDVVFTGIAGDAISLTVSLLEDTLYRNSQTPILIFTGVAGDITTGKARLILDVVHGSLKNGQYAN